MIGTGGAVAPLLTARLQRYTELTPYGLVALFLLTARWRQLQVSPNLEACARRVVRGLDLRSVVSRCPLLTVVYPG
jgi:hypothetical protein